MKGNIAILTMKKGNTKAIIIWDFDGVLFDTSRQRLDNIESLVKAGISQKAILGVSKEIRAEGHFSISRLIRLLRKREVVLSARKVHSIFNTHWASGKYYASETDRMLHHLGGLGFRHILLSMGTPSFQYRKIFVGCGAPFRNHFTQMRVTRRPKYITISKIRKSHPHFPIIFVDDTKENLDLVRKHVPGVKTIYYSNTSRKTLKSLQGAIFSYAKSKN